MSTKAQAQGEAVGLVCADSQCSSDLEGSWDRKPQYSFQSTCDSESPSSRESWCMASHLIYFLTFTGRFSNMQNVIEYKIPRRDGEKHCHIKIKPEIENLCNTDRLKCHSCGYDFICLYPLFSGYHLPPSIPHVALQGYSNTPLYSPECQHIRRMQKRSFMEYMISLISFMCVWIDFEAEWFVRYTVWHWLLCEVCLLIFQVFFFERYMPLLSLWRGFRRSASLYIRLFIMKNKKVVLKRHNS